MSDSKNKDNHMSTDLMPFQETQLMPTGTQAFSILDPLACNHLWKLALTFSKSDLVPEQFRGKPANTFIGLQIAARAGLDPFGVLQNIYVIQGKPAFETKLAIALLNCSGKIRGPVRYRHDGLGKDRCCTATVIDAATGETISHQLHWKTVEDEGWVTKAGSKWKSDPLQMLKYRTAMQLIRTTYPEVLLGMYSVEEVEEMRDRDRVQNAEFWREKQEGPAMIEQAVQTLDAQVLAEQQDLPADDSPLPSDLWNQAKA